MSANSQDVLSPYQPMPPLSAEEYDDLKADIAARGVLVPVEYDEAGEILDGHHRVQICEELGITEWPRVLRLGLSEAEKLTHARKLNLARRHLDRERRRALIASQLRETPQLSDRQIAEDLGVSPTTVGTVRGELETSGELSKLDSRISADGRERPATQPERLIPLLARGTGEMEWYTPGPFVEAARDVMGGIDLDPASNAEANETVRATRIFTAAEDGLARPWAGRLFLNPPYSRPREFIDKLVAEYAAGQVSQAILLTNNCSDTGWFHQAARAAALMCFTRGRIAFTRPGGGGPGAALQGQTFFYFGSQAGAFAQRFSQIGLVVTTVVLERGAA